ncbi:hypothetical protein PQX77_016392 [Marasmius sp. AFHP31]|nr:hypothetical protein PQX77_016392 [Marasmius sp. AFHP31]
MSSPYPGMTNRPRRPNGIRPGALQALEDAEERINAASKSDKTIASDNSEKHSAIKSKINGFAESSDVLLKVLEEVKDIHPFVGVAVIAFKAVVKLELTRRENEDKVIFLLVKIQDLMEVLVQLRAIPPEKKSSDGRLTVEGKLASLCIKIKKDIETCGNLCDTFSKKRFLVKLLKGPIYEIRLAEMGQTFDERQRELEFALLLFTAHGVQSHKDALRAAQDDISMLLLLRMLQSPEEKECAEFIKAKGGPVKCMQDEAILAELIQMRRGVQDDEDTEQDTRVGSSAQQPETGHTQTYPSHRPNTTNSTPAPPVHFPYYPSPHHTQQSAYARTAYPYQSGHQRPPHQSSSNWQQGLHGTYGHSNRYGAQIYVQEPGFHSRPGSPTGPSPYPSHPYNTEPTGYSSRTPFPTSGAQEHPSQPQGYSSRTHYGTKVPTVPDTGETRVQRLKEDLEQDVDEEVSKNSITFLRKFDEQQRQLVAIERSVIKQGDRVVQAVREGAHDRIHDKELREIWKEMGWKLVVPATEFVLTLHDYFVAQHHDMTILDEHFNHPPAPGSTTADQEMAALSRALKAAKLRSEEKWALKSLHFSKLKQVEEAFDADSSGYVSVWEANQVLSLRPSEWSLLQWLAYWASGRHWTISEYRLKIADIYQDMILMLRHKVQPSNRYTVDRYLNNMKTLDRVLSSTIPCPDPPQGELAKRVSRYNQQEEERMEQVLKALDYEIDGPDTIELITSRYQIERNFFPLVYLLLRRHMSVIRLACDIALDPRELEQATKSLKVIFRAVKSRVATLRFTTPLGYPPDLTLILQTFAFGMLQYYSVYTKWRLHYLPLPNDPALIADTQPAPVGWLARGVPPSLESSEREFHSLQDPIRFEKCIGKYMNGYWTGYLSRHDGAIRGGVLQFRISNWKGSTFDGEGCFSEGIIRIEGAYDHKKNILLARIVGAADNGVGQGGSSDLRVFITGSLETIVSSPILPKQYVVTAVWGESKNDRSGGTATFSQIPAWIYQFRSRIPGHPSYPARERWSYALKAVLYRVRCQRGVLQKAYCLEKLKCIRRSVYLLKQRYFIGTSTTDDEEESGLTWLPPPESRLCRWLALFAFWPSVHL